MKTYIFDRMNFKRLLFLVGPLILYFQTAHYTSLHYQYTITAITSIYYYIYIPVLLLYIPVLLLYALYIKIYVFILYYMYVGPNLRVIANTDTLI